MKIKRPPRKLQVSKIKIEEALPVDENAEKSITIKIKRPKKMAPTVEPESA
jgi:hypothetical protein